MVSESLTKLLNCFNEIEAIIQERDQCRAEVSRLQSVMSAMASNAKDQGDLSRAEYLRSVIRGD